MSEKQPEVAVFTMPFCSTCHALMDWMAKNDIAYTEKNIEDKEVREATEKALGKQFDGAPTTVINGEMIDGFDRKAILKALGR